MKNQSIFYNFFDTLFLKRGCAKYPFSAKRKLSGRSKKTLGFTLIEVLVVVIIVGILSAIAAPGWLAFMNNQRISTSQSRVFSTLRDAQSSARKSSSTRTFVIGNDPTKGSYSVVVNSQNQVDLLRTGTAVSALVPPPDIQYLEQGVKVLSVTPTTVPSPSFPLTISFNSQGLPTKVNNETFTDFPLRVTLNVTNSPNRKRCTTITTLLGAMKSGSDTDC